MCRPVPMVEIAPLLVHHLALGHQTSRSGFVPRFVCSCSNSNIDWFLADNPRQVRRTLWTLRLENGYHHRPISHSPAVWDYGGEEVRGMCSKICVDPTSPNTVDLSAYVWCGRCGRARHSDIFVGGCTYVTTTVVTQLAPWMDVNVFHMELAIIDILPFSMLVSFYRAELREFISLWTSRRPCLPYIRNLMYTTSLLNQQSLSKFTSQSVGIINMHQSLAHCLGEHHVVLWRKIMWARQNMIDCRYKKGEALFVYEEKSSVLSLLERASQCRRAWRWINARRSARRACP